MANKKASVDTVRTGIEEITTQGDLLYKGAADLERLPKGTSGQTLKMGSGNEPEWVTVDASSGGAWNFISSGTASSSTSVDFTSGINSTYDTYMLTITSLVASSSSLRPFLQVSVGGTFATANYHYYVNGYGSGGGAVDAGAAYGESMRLQGNTNMYSDTAKAGSGIIYFHNPASTTTYSNFHWKWTFWSLTDVVMNDHGSGLYNGSTGAIDGVRLLAGASGNFTSGTFRLYGLAKS